MSWEIIAFLAATVNGVILSIIFLVRKGTFKHKALGLFLLFFSVTIFHYVNFWEQLFEPPIFIRWIFALADWLLPPLLFSYFSGEKELKRFRYHTIVPGLFVTYWFLIQFASMDSEFYVHVVRFITITKTIFFLSYGWAMVKLKSELRLSKLFLIPYLIFALSVPFYFLSQYWGFYTLKLDYLVCASFVVLTYMITYLSEFDFLKADKYASSSLTREDGDLLIQKINTSLAQNKYYKNPDFNLTYFAEKLGVPKYRISHALNVYSKKTFSELINDFRIKEAQGLLEDESSIHLKLEAVGEQAGFKNKVSFYKHFKQRVGKSPKKYQQMVHSQKV